MPITEIQACGRPAIVTDWTSMSELVIEGETGFKVKPGYKRFSPLMSYVADPDPKDIYQAMENTFAMDRERTRKACVKNILDNYDILDLVRNSWIPFFEEVQADIYKE